MAKAMTMAQIGQLGGFASARAAGHDELSERGSKGGATTAERYGREHFIRAAHKRWNRLKTSPGAVSATASGPAVPLAPAASGTELTPREDVPLRSASREPYAAKQSKSTDIP